jgi:DNA polymerase-3 subunit delta
LAASPRNASPESILKKSLDSGKISPVYLLYGSETNRLQKAVDLLHGFIEKSAGDPNTAWTAFDLAEEGFGNFEAELKSISFFGGTRGVYVTNFGVYGEGARAPQGELRLGEPEQEKILAYLEKPAPDLILVMRAEKPDMRLKFWKNLKKGAETFAFESSESDRGVLIAEALKESGLTFSRDAAGWLIERFTGNFKPFESELEKLISYMGEKKDVSIEDVENCMSVPKYERIWELTEAVAKGDADMSLRILKSLQNQSETYLMVLPMIAREFRLMLFCQTGRKKGKTMEETAASCGIDRAWTLKKYWSRPKLPNAETLKSFLHRMHKTDVRVRSSSLNPWNALENEILSFINERKTHQAEG